MVIENHSHACLLDHITGRYNCQYYSGHGKQNMVNPFFQSPRIGNLTLMDLDGSVGDRLSGLLSSNMLPYCLLDYCYLVKIDISRYRLLDGFTIDHSLYHHAW